MLWHVYNILGIVYLDTHYQFAINFRLKIALGK